MARSKKPDLFERMAHNLSLEHTAAPFATQILLEAWPGIEWRIAKLLRREHAWIVRMAKREFCTEHAASSQKIIGWNQAIECILHKLNKRRLG